VGTDLSWREQAFLSWLAPRGIVAAAVASLFAFELQDLFPQAAEALVPVVFLVIVGTVAVYGLTIPYLAHWLGLADPNPEGVLFVGADTWVQRVAEILQGLGITVQLVDSNPDHVERARERGLSADRADVLSEEMIEDLDLSGIGRLIIAIPNDEVASLSALHLSEVFDVNDIFQLPARSGRRHAEGDVPEHLRGNVLFGDGTSCEEIRDCFEHGYDAFVVEGTADMDREEIRDRFGTEAFPMFIVRGERLIILSDEQSTQPHSGDRIVLLARDDQSEAEETMSVEEVADRPSVADLG
jgi:hypothetical protein